VSLIRETLSDLLPDFLGKYPDQMQKIRIKELLKRPPILNTLPSIFEEKKE
jgi:hypothetical protein